MEAVIGKVMKAAWFCELDKACGAAVDTAVWALPCGHRRVGTAAVAPLAVEDTS